MTESHQPVESPTASPDRDSARTTTSATTRSESSSTGHYGLLQYLEALYPSAPRDQLLGIIKSSSDWGNIAAEAYNVINPDVYSYSYLKAQHTVRCEPSSTPAEKAAAFSGISETLQDRADDVFLAGQFGNLSQRYEYEDTVRVFGIDTSSWDEAFILPPKSLEDAMYQCLRLSDDDLVGGLPSPQCSTAPQRGRTPSPSLERASPSKRRDRHCCSRAATSPPLSFENYVDDHISEELPAPIVRWAPRALRVGPFDAQHDADTLFQFADPSVDGQNHIVIDLRSPGATPERQPLQPPESLPPAQQQQPQQQQQGSSVKIIHHSPKTNEPICFVNDGTVRRKERSQTEPLVSHESYPSRLASIANITSPLTAAAPNNDNTNHTEAKPTNKKVDDKLQSAADDTKQKKKAMVSAQLSDLALDALDDLKDIISSQSSSPNPQMVSQAADPMLFLQREEERWNTICTLLHPQEHLVDNRGRFFIIQHIHDLCPSFVGVKDELLKSLLHVLSAELPGKTVLHPISEVPVEVPLFGVKLVSLGAVVMKELSFAPSKAKIEFRGDGTRVKIKLRVKQLSTEPIPFAYMDESSAAREQRLLREENAKFYANEKSVLHTTLSRGATKGEVTLAASKVDLSAEGIVVIHSSGGVSLSIEKCSVSIGTLKVATNVTKLNVLCTVGKPVLKLIVESAIRNALLGPHVL